MPSTVAIPNNQGNTYYSEQDLLISSGKYRQRTTKLIRNDLQL